MQRITKQFVTHATCAVELVILTIRKWDVKRAKTEDAILSPFNLKDGLGDEIDKRKLYVALAEGHALESESHTITEGVKRHHEGHQALATNFGREIGALTRKPMRKDTLEQVMKETCCQEPPIPRPNNASDLLNVHQLCPISPITRA